MTPESPPNFKNQDLRNRSFTRQRLDGADFSGADIRGCNFSHASLRGANFQAVQAGQTLRQVLGMVAMVGSMGGVMGNAISLLIFGALGRTAAEAGWSLNYALGTSTAIAGWGAALWAIAPQRSWLSRIAMMAAGTASGALLAFFYGGIFSDRNLQVAAIAATLGGILMATLSVYCQSSWLYLAIMTAAIVAGYGFAFFVGTWAIACLTTQHLAWGILWSLLSLLSIGCSVASIQFVIKMAQTMPGTVFRRADLTDACFDGAIVANTDVTGAIGAEAIRSAASSLEPE